ncbi:MAG: DNA oxidative demethylase AlkB [Glaciimonas sp.]|nr:DNA oxidative demethylase AlkB [Glaciimonas sp.]
MTLPLFDDVPQLDNSRLALCDGALVLRQFALQNDVGIFAALDVITKQAPFRHLITPGGFTMSVRMTNCGELGWVSDRRGYRYDRVDPESGLAWPQMPAVFLTLARDAAAAAGFAAFVPDACLINCYQPDARLSLHQDKDEHDYDQPIVSVSLGVPAIFLFGGLQRTDKAMRVPLMHGDVVVWGAAARLRYHGVLPIKENTHPLTGNLRINLTFRKAA